MKEQNIEICDFIKNKKFIYCVIVVLSLFLYYEVRKDEEHLEKIKENNIINKNKQVQKEDDINLTNSKYLNMKIDKENIKKLILEEKEKEEQDIQKKQEEDKIELWKIETFFATLFCVIYGGLYYYAYNGEKKNKPINEENTYLIDDYTKYLLDETEIEYLINKEEKSEYNYL